MMQSYKICLLQNAVLVNNPAGCACQPAQPTTNSAMQLQHSLCALHTRAGGRMEVMVLHSTLMVRLEPWIQVLYKYCCSAGP